jgi:hypothetical protein
VLGKLLVVGGGVVGIRQGHARPFLGQAHQDIRLAKALEDQGARRPAAAGPARRASALPDRGWMRTNHAGGPGGVGLRVGPRPQERSAGSRSPWVAPGRRTRPCRSGGSSSSRIPACTSGRGKPADPGHPPAAPPQCPRARGGQQATLLLGQVPCELRNPGHGADVYSATLPSEHTPTATVGQTSRAGTPYQEPRRRRHVRPRPPLISQPTRRRHREPSRSGGSTGLVGSSA